MITNLNKNVAGVVLVIIATIFFSLQGILVKLLYQEGFSGLEVLFMRALICTPVFALYAFIRMPKGTILSLNKNILVTSVLIGVVGYYMGPIVDYTALTKIDVGVERMLFYIFPAFVMAINSILHKSLPSKIQVSAFCIIELGIYLVMGGFNTHVNAVGAALAICAAFLFAIYIILNQHISRHIHHLPFLLLAFLGGMAAVSVHYFANFQTLPQISEKAYFLIAMLALFCTFLPLIALFEGIKCIGSNRAAFISAIGPVMATLLAYFILGEKLQSLQILGGAVIVFAILWLEYRGKKLSYQERM